MIGVRLMDRLGNNLFQYAAARGLAQRHATGVAVMGTPSRLSSLALRADTVFVDEAGQAHAGWLEHRERSFTFDSGVAQLPDQTLLAGYFQSERYFRHIADELRVELRPRSEPAPRDMALLDRFAATQSVAVHVRRGDYVTSPRAAMGHGALGPTYYRNALRELRRRGIEPEVIVFSDDPGWCQANLELGAPTIWMRTNVEAPEQDLLLMAGCRHHVIANSSFSWWGAWLGKRPGQVVLAPSRWFAGYDHDTSDLLPAGWVTVPR
jgi:hypothetical protein